jgi:hypothetical protein
MDDCDSDSGSAEDQFWNLVPQASKKGISRKRLTEFADLYGRDFDAILAVTRKVLAAKNPSAYFNKVVETAQQQAEAAEYDQA